MPDWDYNNPIFPGGEVPDEICYDDWGNIQSCSGSFFDDSDNPLEIPDAVRRRRRNPNRNTTGLETGSFSITDIQNENKPLLLLMGSYLVYILFF